MPAASASSPARAAAALLGAAPAQRASASGSAAPAPGADPATAHAAPLRDWLRRKGQGPAPGLQAGRPRVAVVGGGVAGLSAAWALAEHAHVTLFEADARPGGHAHTVDVELDGVRHGVDTGFLVYNERTYPLLIQLFEQLGIETAPSDMSFSVQVPGIDLEWSGHSLATVFAQKRNLLRPAFWGMLTDLLRFNRVCTQLALSGDEARLAQPIGDFLREQGFGAAFRDWYLLPMVACIWSCPTAQMLAFPVRTLIRFCHNHGLLQVENRPQWFTVRGGSRHYVEALLPAIQHVRLGTPVRAVARHEGGVTLTTDAGPERFDHVVLAGHSDQSLALLQDASIEERAVLGAIAYQPNRAVLHLDERLLPTRRAAWAAWNYERAAGSDASPAAERVCLHYLLNRLQPLPWQRSVVVSLNPVREPDPALVLREIEYAHPVFDEGAVRAQAQLPALQGQGGVWFAGAWTRYGFHEDGMLSGLTVAQALEAKVLAHGR